MSSKQLSSIENDTFFQMKLFLKGKWSTSNQTYVNKITFTKSDKCIGRFHLFYLTMGAIINNNKTVWIFQIRRQPLKKNARKLGVSYTVLIMIGNDRKLGVSYTVLIMIGNEIFFASYLTNKTRWVWKMNILTELIFINSGNRSFYLH